MVRVSIDTDFNKSELLRMPVHVLRTIDLSGFGDLQGSGGLRRSYQGCCAAASRAFKHHDAVKTAGGRVGTKLFHRHSRKLLLSAEGKLLLAYASFVPEGQHDSSQERSAWNHGENSPVPAGRLNRSRLRLDRSNKNVGKTCF